MHLGKLAGAVVGLGLLTGCRQNEQLEKARIDSLLAGNELSAAAQELARYASVDQLSRASAGGQERLKITLEEATAWKARVDARFADFTNGLSLQIVTAERASSSSQK